jgi:hypothetical protein
MEIPHPDLQHSRANVDFGRGFYTTTIYEQAEKWGSKFIKNGNCGVISEYELAEAELCRLKVKKFDSYSEE